MSLETKSITELRGIAQAIGVAFKWSDDKPQLIKAIDEKAYEKLKPDEPVALA